MRKIEKWKNPSEFTYDQNLKFIDNPVSPGRKYATIELPKFREEAFAAFGYFKLKEEPIYKNFLGINYLPETSVHMHKDVAPLNYSHVRCNWVISKPKQGGNPIINGKEIEVEPGDLWICYASEEMHGTTKIYEGIRKILSFGALIPLKDVVQNLRIFYIKN